MALQQRLFGSGGHCGVFKLFSTAMSALKVHHPQHAIVFHPTNFVRVSVLPSIISVACSVLNRYLTEGGSEKNISYNDNTSDTGSGGRHSGCHLNKSSAGC